MGRLLLILGGAIFLGGRGAKEAGEGVDKASNGGVKLALSGLVIFSLWQWFKRRG